jgi:glycosyltransferase involved in cell wall biosynthesis
LLVFVVKVCIGSAGRFHTFDLARQMDRLSHLQRVYTAYPKWKVDCVPKQKLSTFPWLLVPQLALGRYGLRAGQETMNRLVIQTFDRWMARNLEDCDVFHGLAGFCLDSHEVAKSRGALTVCDRGSSHILYQDQLLTEEYRRWNVPFRQIDGARDVAEYEGCDLICVPSMFVYNSFVEMGVPETKLRKISYGVDLDLFKPVPKQDQTFRVIYVGALSLRKGIPYLLQALAGIHLPQFEVWLIGSVLPEVRTILAKHEGQFRYLGVIPRTDLYKYYGQASVLVLPSVEEGLALVQAQAMACGLPIIATTNTGAEDLFTDGVEGFIVPIRSANVIHEKVLYLYENPDVRERMVGAALRRVRSLGGWDIYGERMVATYQDALTGCRRATA